MAHSDGKVAAPRELKQGGNQLAVSQVAGRTEEHDGARVGDARPRQGLTQGVGFGKRGRFGHRDRSRRVRPAPPAGTSLEKEVILRR